MTYFESYEMILTQKQHDKEYLYHAAFYIHN